MVVNIIKEKTIQEAEVNLNQSLNQSRQNLVNVNLVVKMHHLDIIWD
jgi:hypothetical protein